MRTCYAVGIITVFVAGMVCLAGCTAPRLATVNKSQVVSLFEPTTSPRIVYAAARQMDADHLQVTYQGGQNAAACVGVSWTVTDAAGSPVDRKLMGTDTGTASAAPLAVGSQAVLAATAGNNRVVATAYFTDGSAKVILDTTITVTANVPLPAGSPVVSGGSGTVSATVPATVTTHGLVRAEYAGASPWSGPWDSDWGTMEFAQSGSHVTATYDYHDGRITGTVSGNTLTGTWSQSPSYQPPEDAGDVVFVMAADGNTLTGSWRFGTGTGTWDGTWTATRQ